jgi:hypothetical protein
MIIARGTVEPKYVIEEITDPMEVARSVKQHEQAQRNIDWLQSHWSELLPRALGKFLAVAGQEAFLADTPKEAITRAEAAHPGDKGLLVQYVRPEQGPCIYENRRPVDPLLRRNDSAHD